MNTEREHLTECRREIRTVLYQVRIGNHGLRRADSMNWLVTRILTRKRTGEEYESSSAAAWSSTLRLALECLYQRVLDEAI